MSRLRRLLVVLLVALALPMQALAAAAMMHCADAGVAVEQGHHGHGDPGQGHAGHGLPDAAPDDTAFPADPGAAHACSACAVCCTMAAFPAMALPLPGPERVPAAQADAPQPAAMFLTSGVERPPRPRG